MAIEKEVPKDISKYESKVVGPFTLRQIVFGIPGAAAAVGSHFLLRQWLPSDVNFFVNAIIALPFFLCAVYKPYGVPFEKYVSIVFVSMVLSPKHRKYHTENIYRDLLTTEDDNESSDENKKKKNKKNKIKKKSRC